MICLSCRHKITKHGFGSKSSHFEWCKFHKELVANDQARHTNPVQGTQQ